MTQRLLPLVLIVVLAGGATPAPLTEIEQADLVQIPFAILQEGDLEGARVGFDEALRRLGPDGLRTNRLQLLSGLAFVLRELGEDDAALSVMVEAIGVADVLAADPHRSRGEEAVGARLGLAGVLYAAGRYQDAEAAAWDALDIAVARKLPLEISGAPVVVILLSALHGGADRAAVEGLLTELDLALTPLNDYRLYVPPPPDALVAILEAHAQQLAAAGEAAGALELFAAVTALDEARGADWRRASDLDQLAFAALQVGDLARARWAIHEALEALSDPPALPLLGNLCALAMRERDAETAVVVCRAAAEQAESVGDGFVHGALLSRVAGIRAAAGDVDEAVSVHIRAARAFDDAQRPGDGLLERARAASALVAAGRLDEGLRRYESSVEAWESDTTVVAEWGPQPIPAVVAEIGVDLRRARLESGTLEPDELERLQAEVQAELFEQERGADLLDVALQHVRDAIARDEGVEEAVEAIVQLQDGLGLGPVGWWGAYATGLAADGKDRAVAWSDAVDRQEWLERDTWRDPEELVQPPLEPGLHEEFVGMLIDHGRPGEALEIAERARGLKLMRRLPRPASGSPELARVRARIDELRLRMETVSFRGGARPPAEVRAELAPRLQAHLAAEAELVDGLEPRLRALQTVPRVTPGLPPGTVVVGMLRLEDGWARLTWHDDVVTAERVDADIDAALLAWSRSAERPSGRWKAARDPALRQLSDVLLRPVEEQLQGARQVVWIPDGPAVEVPFGALLLEDGTPVAQRLPVATFPSIPLLQLAVGSPWTPPTSPSQIPPSDAPLSAGSVTWFPDECGGRPLRVAEGFEGAGAWGEGPADGRLDMVEALEHGWPASVAGLPGCADDLWGVALLMAGSRAVIRPIGDKPDGAYDLLKDKLYDELLAGTEPLVAMQRAQLHVRRRWKDPRVWAGWEFAAPPTVSP